MKYSDTASAQNELAILQQLRAFNSDKFNFVKYNDAFIDKGKFCFEFEKLDISLRDFLKQRASHPLSVKEIRPILHQMATALQFLKSLGVVHTDLKPDNIMLVDHVKSSLKVKMIDFGLAGHVSQAKRGVYIQTRYYRSPEVILGLPITTAIDMWSLGCIAAELFLGYVLYPGSFEYEMLRHMVGTQGQPPQHLLDKGITTRNFFCRNRDRERRWRLKTPLEYGRVTRAKSYFNSLDDLKKIRPACHLSDEDTTAEIKDLESFVDLLKKMLRLNTDKRIGPSHLLEDPFITMSDLADRYPSSLYVKSGAEMMEVCQDQSQPWLNPQAYTSAACTTSRLSSSVHKKQTPSELQLPSTSEAQSCTGQVRPVQKRKRDSYEATQSGDRSALTERKRMKMDFIETHAELPETSKEAPAEASSRTATAKPPRKRTWDTFIASHSELRNPYSGSPERKKMKVSLLHVPKEAPTEAPSSEARMKPQRKRTWDTFVASHTGYRSSSPERKKRKMSLEEMETQPKHYSVGLRSC